jgi:D-alanyl-D-alanine carboxypeptidase
MIKVFLLCILLLTNSSKAIYPHTAIYAQSYVVMDGYSKQVLESKDMSLVRSVASISKIMTAIIAIENGDLSTNITISDEIKKAYGSMIYASIGDVYTLEELLYGLMLRSGNDAAMMIAKHIGGSVEHFVEMMNEKANDLRMKNSTFVNPHGLDEQDGGNLSTAYDMALLLSYASNNPIFNKISGTRLYNSPHKGLWENKNRLLSLYQNTISGKTGYTRKAKRTLATAAMKDATHLVIVTINCGGDFSLHKQLYENYFNKLERRILLSKGEHNVSGYKFTLTYDVTYQLDKVEWNNYRLMINIVEKENKCYIYLIDNQNKTTLLESVKVEKITDHNSKTNWFDGLWKWLKGVFSYG